MSRFFEPGVPVNVHSGSVPVQRVLCPNASMMTGPGTNSYLIGEREMALVDPGPADDRHTDAILNALAGRVLRKIFVTHTHSDHSPGTRLLQLRTGAEVIGLAPPEEGHHDRSFQPSRHYQAGERIDCDEYVMHLLHTPGHVSNHFCFLLEKENMLFTGDHILEGMTPVILPPDGSMSAYLHSLQTLQQLELAALAPGHGEVMRDPGQVIGKLIRHRLQREQKVVNGLQELGPCTLDTLVLRVYDDVQAHLIPWAKKTLLAHLIKLEEEKRIACSGEHWEQL
ncbi:MAG: MBL fold metallo-hydrolase [Pseudomonadales bacterium]|nr:MBL fold metallo-hydrolase [Pseudomonadales bacterium]